jgi:hypothetical protein
MNSLRYTNALLTIIALALSAIAVEKNIRPTPSSEIQLVAICGVPSHICLEVERAQGNALDVHVVR